MLTQPLSPQGAQSPSATVRSITLGALSALLFCACLRLDETERDHTSLAGAQAGSNAGAHLETTDATPAVTSPNADMTTPPQTPDVGYSDMETSAPPADMWLLDSALPDMALPPDAPALIHTTQGRFRITNHSAALTYELVGPGQVTQDLVETSNPSGDYELRARSRDGLLSEATLFGRRPFTYTRVHVRDDCVSCNCVENRVATCNEPPGGGGVCPNPDLQNATCGCYDADQNRCICWSYGDPRQLCEQCCTPVYEDQRDELAAPYVAEDGEWYWIDG